MYPMAVRCKSCEKCGGKKPVPGYKYCPVCMAQERKNMKRDRYLTAYPPTDYGDDLGEDDVYMYNGVRVVKRRR